MKAISAMSEERAALGRIANVVSKKVRHKEHVEAVVRDLNYIDAALVRLEEAEGSTRSVEEDMCNARLVKGDLVEVMVNNQREYGTIKHVDGFDATVTITDGREFAYKIWYIKKAL